MIKKLVKVKEKYDEIQEMLIDPDLLSDQKRYVKLAKESKNLEPIANLFDAYVKVSSSLEADRKALNDETDEEMKAMLSEEIELAEAKLKELEAESEILLLPKDEDDEKNVIVEIRSGAGGDEASLFGAEVMRMLIKFAEGSRYKVEMMDVSETELGGVKDATFMIKGAGAFARFKYESGVHRVQRVPDTETQGRVHTSTITVAVLPEQEDIDFDINEKDLKVDVYRASGAGGQHVNKTESAVRITHLPTGMVVASQDQRSQIQNREKCMNLLKSKLYDHFKSEKDEEYAKKRKDQVGTGDRSERIRTYNYPQGRVTDHRINMTVYSLTNFLNGDMKEMIDSLERASQKAKLEASAE